MASKQFTVDIDLNSNKALNVATPSASTDGANKGYVDTADQNNANTYAVASGTNTYAISLTPTLTSYVAGQTFKVKFTNANSGASTLNADTLGAISLVKQSGVALASGDIKANQIYIVTYDGTNFQIIGIDNDVNFNPDNFVLVKQLSDFPAPVGGVITLVDNVNYQINGAINLGTNKITVGANNKIVGYTAFVDSLVYTGNGALFTGVSKNLSIENITITASTSGAVLFAMTGSAYNFVFRNSFAVNCYGFGAITGANLCFVENIYGSTITTGFVFNTITNLNFVDNVMKLGQSTITWATVGATVFDAITISRNYFDINAGQTGLNISASSTVNLGTLSNNQFDNLGTILTGIIFTQNNWKFSNNNNIRDGICVFVNVIVVRVLSDFPTPVGGVITLLNDTTYIITGAVNIGTNQITIGTNCKIMGNNRSTDSLTYTGSSVMFTGVSNNFWLENLTITANTSLATVFAFTGSSYFFTAKFVKFVNCYGLGSVTGADQCLYEDNYHTSITLGITFSTIENLMIFDNNFKVGLSTVTWVTLLNSTFDAINIARNYLDILAGQTGMNISASITLTVGVLGNNNFDSAGTALTGITYATAKWNFANNSGIANRSGSVFTPACDIAGEIGASPVTTATTTNYLSTSGVTVLTFDGTNCTVNGCAFEIKVPSDYFSGGVFEISWTSVTGTPNNISLQMILTKPAIGVDINTQTETGLRATFASTTQYQRRMNTITPVTTVFSADDLVIVRLFREARVAPDVFTSSLYVIGVRFSYNAK